MRILSIVAAVILCLGSTSVQSAEAQRIHREHAGSFQYIEPNGWMRVPPRKQKYSFLLEKASQGKPVNRNVQFEDIGQGENTRVLAAQYLERFRKALPDFHLLQESHYVNRAGHGVSKIVHVNSLPGRPVRQINYFIGDNRARLLITCTVLASDGGRYDDVFRFLIDSIRFY